MRIKQKIIIVVSLFMVTITLGSVWVGSETAYALTKEQCISKYHAKSAPIAGYQDTNCDQSQSGPCKVESAGATADAERYDCKDELDEVDKDEEHIPNTGSGCGGAETAIIKCDADNGGDITTNGIWALLLMAINILTAGIGIAAVGGIIYGSILYTTAGDNDGQITQAKEVIRNVIIGIILYVAMYAILQFIIPGGVFTP